MPHYSLQPSSVQQGPMCSFGHKPSTKTLPARAAIASWLHGWFRSRLCSATQWRCVELYLWNSTVAPLTMMPVYASDTSARVCSFRTATSQVVTADQKPDFHSQKQLRPFKIEARKGACRLSFLLNLGNSIICGLVCCSATLQNTSSPLHTCYAAATASLFL